MSDAAPKKRPNPRRPALSLQELRFCTRYAESGNASEAYRAAFPARDAGVVRMSAFRLLRKAAIRDRIWQLREEACAVEQITVNRLAQALARIAFANRADLFDRHGCLLPAAEWPADVAATVEGIDTEDLFELVSEKGEPKRKELRGYTRKVKTARRTEAIKLLMQWKRMIQGAAEEEFEAELARLREMLQQYKAAPP